MPIPDYVVALRQKVGHHLLLLPGVVAVVVDHAGRVSIHDSEFACEPCG